MKMSPEAGLELAQPYRRRILKVLRLLFAISINKLNKYKYAL